MVLIMALNFKYLGLFPPLLCKTLFNQMFPKLSLTPNQLTGDSISDKSSLQPILESVSNKSQL